MPTWVLVADNSRARFFMAEKPASPLAEVQDLAYPEARLHEGHGAHGFGNDGTAKQEGADRFALMVCNELEAARNSGSFRKLYVVAAPAFLGMLRKHQSPALKQLVAGEVDKNLATQDPSTIRKHLPDYL